MKKFLLISCLAFAAVFQSAADNLLNTFLLRVASSCVTFEYSYKAEGGVSMTGSGNAKVQGDAFVLEGDGLEIWCDGSQRWSVDRSAKEVLIETLAEGHDFAGNPALLVSCLDEAFKEVSSGSEKFRGRSLRCVKLAPVAEAGISGLSLFFDGEGNLRGVVMTADDGTRTEFVISKMEFLYPKDLSLFTFDSSGLDGSWVITDLR